jgi:TolB-like protein/cytochrome c-type biogenesis protein CcmH/NrfG
VRVFRVALGHARPAKPIWPQHNTAPAVRRGRWSARIWAIGVAVVLIAGAGGAALYFHLGRAPVVSQMPEQLAKPSERFSIVVLPFTNLSGDASQDYLADVISDELATGFSRFRDSFVISRSTAFTYKGKPIDVRQIGKNLGVRYVLEGSVQPNGDRLRVHAQLIDTESDAHVWADQFDENRSDLLQMQDAIVTRIARAIGIKITVERARWAQTRAANPNAEDFAWRCTAALMRTYWTPEQDSAYRLCEQALQIDPENVRALSYLSFKFIHRASSFASPDRQADIRRADELASLAIKIDPNFSPAHTAKGDVLLSAGRYREAIDSYRRAEMLFPSSIQPGLALAYAYVGEAEQAIAYADKVMRLSPQDPLSTWPILYLAKALAFGILQDYKEAIVWTERAEAAAPEMQLLGLVRSALLALADREADARATMQRYLASDNAPVRTQTQWKALWQAPLIAARGARSTQWSRPSRTRPHYPSHTHLCGSRCRSL